MSESLFFYDLETSGKDPSKDRIMQFAGQRTDTELKPIGDPFNVIIRLNEDVLPDPEAILIHGITPQQTISDGISEAEFLEFFYQKVVTDNTVFVGFNNISFDDEFIRYINYRNLYDPYAWAYENGASRWDLIDVVRMTRALRPEGINWPVDALGVNTNKLALLAEANSIKHESAHDALSDVLATIDVARLIKQKQTKLYDYLFGIRTKQKAAELVNSGQPFIYTSPHLNLDYLHTTVVTKVAEHTKSSSYLVYDLRYDPSPWIKMDIQELVDSWRYVSREVSADPRLPVINLKLNRCPAIAPYGVVKDAATLQRLRIDLDKINYNSGVLEKTDGSFSDKLLAAFEILDQERKQKSSDKSVDSQLYDGFYSEHDRRLIGKFHQNPDLYNIQELKNDLEDPRLRSLCDFYVAHNNKKQLTQEERIAWDKYLNQRLFNGGEASLLARYFKKIEQLLLERTDPSSKVLLEDLKLYGESLMPSYIEE